MCFAHGSIDQATKACPMCKVFKPSGARCPHVKEICRNRSVHPRYDVVYFKNAEVQTFNGCGYCKWVKTVPTPRSPGYQNLGWPGCCRAPTSGESRYIQAADWPAVSIVHHIPIPSEVKSILDSIGVPPSRTNTSSPQSPQSPSPTASLGRSANLQTAGYPPVVRRTSANAVTITKPEASSTKNGSVAITYSGRPSNSPPKTTSPLGKPSRASLEANSPRAGEHGDRNGDSPPGRKQVELDSTLTYRTSGRRSSVSSITSLSSSGKANPDHQPDRERRRTLNAINTNTLPPNRRPSPPGPSRSQGKNGNLEAAMAGVTIASPSSASSSGSSASSDHTVDGGFTDYLSDESEAELQRQAEIKAALVAQNRMEEKEFRAARQQLANVDLRPPKSWNPDVANSSRSQMGSQVTPNHGPAYVPTGPAFTSAPYAHV